MDNSKVQKALYLLSILVAGYFIFFAGPTNNLALIVIAFLVLCNLPNLTGTIKSIVKDEITEHAKELIPGIKEELRKDKEFIRTLIEQSNQEEKEPKINPENINK